MRFHRLAMLCECVHVPADMAENDYTYARGPLHMSMYMRVR